MLILIFSWIISDSQVITQTSGDLSPLRKRPATYDLPNRLTYLSLCAEAETIIPRLSDRQIYWFMFFTKAWTLCFFVIMFAGAVTTKETLCFFSIVSTGTVITKEIWFCSIAVWQLNHVKFLDVHKWNFYINFC